MTAGSVNSVPSSRTTLPETKMAGAVETGPVGGKVEEPVEPGGVGEGLLPPERWARAEALNAMTRKIQRKNGVHITHPRDIVPGVYRFRRRVERLMSRG